jgi:hypothetical protein
VGISAGVVRPLRAEAAVGRERKKTGVALALACAARPAMKTIADALGWCAQLAVQAIEAPQQRRGRRPQPEGELLVEITDIIAGLPTYGYRRFTP